VDIFYYDKFIRSEQNSKNIHIVKIMLNFLVDILITRNYKYYLIN